LLYNFIFLFYLLIVSVSGRLELGAWSLKLAAWGLRLVVRGSRSLALEALTPTPYNFYGEIFLLVRES